ncbi:hypothetical protein X975_16506, partial [Stegodyphus mimosarum]
MLLRTANYNDPFLDKTPLRKMILLAKDYVQHLRRCNWKEFEIGSKTTDPDSPKCSQLLASLKDDLRCATATFLDDFISAGGIECLLEVLRLCQSRQNDSKAARGRHEQTVLRKLCSNQHDCLLCLKYAMQNPKSVLHVTEDAHGLSSICSSFMSSYPKSRI